MSCIEKIYSVSALIGSNACNANCSFCAAKELRKDAIDNGEVARNFKEACKLSARYGGWSLSLTSTGEPTMSPYSINNYLKEYSEIADQGAYFPNVNLFTNGIKFADDDFCDMYLKYWKSLGLTNIAISFHDVSEEGQARAYGIDVYPSIKKIVNNIRKHGLGVRGTLLLHKDIIDNAKSYSRAVDTLINEYGIDNITSWKIGNPDGSNNEHSPSLLGYLSIRWWLLRNTKSCHSHSWGGGIYDYKGNILRITDYVTKHDPRKDYVRQLVSFQDGTVCYSWIKNGALCLK